MSSVAQRLVLFAEYKGIARRQLEIKAGMCNGLASKVSDKISAVYVNNLEKAFPELNIDWLLTGEGEMLNSDDSVTPQNVEKMKNTIKVLTAKNKILEAENRMYKSQMDTLAEMFKKNLETTVELRKQILPMIQGDECITDGEETFRKK